MVSAGRRRIQAIAATMPSIEGAHTTIAKIPW